jgi:hypothetical protein
MFTISGMTVLLSILVILIIMFGFSCLAAYIVALHRSQQ